MSRGINGFQPGRLLQLLAARRCPQVQIAQMVGVSPSTVSKWRSGQQAPEAQTLDRLASVLNVRPEWFTRPLPPAVSIPLFRSNASAHAPAREMLSARLSWVHEIAIKFSDLVDFPVVQIPELPFDRPDAIHQSDVEKAAQVCRECWGLGRGPIPDVALALENAGAILVREETGVPAIEGLSAWSDVLSRPLILLAADKDNGFRSRFDAAHELGHLVLHRRISNPLDRGSYKEMERQAHAFAGAFLLPAESFAAEIRLPVTLDSLLLLKQRWGVSVAAMVMRLEALGILSSDDKLTLFKRRSARWGAKAEPGDQTRQPEQPRLLRRTVELLQTESILPATTLPEYLGLAPADIEALLGLSCSLSEFAETGGNLAKVRAAQTAMTATSSGANILPFARRRIMS